MFLGKTLHAWLRTPKQRKPTINLLRLGIEHLEDRTCPSWFKHVLHSVERFVRHDIVPVLEQAAVVVASVELGPLGGAAASVALGVAKGESLPTALKDGVTAGIAAEVGAVAGGVLGDVIKPVQAALSSDVGGALGQVISAIPVDKAIQGAVTHDVLTGETNPIQIGKDIVAGVGLAGAGSLLSAGVSQVQTPLANSGGIGSQIAALPTTDVIQGTVLSDIQQGRTALSQVGADLLQAGKVATATGAVGYAAQELSSAAGAVTGTLSPTPAEAVSSETTESATAQGGEGSSVTLEALPPYTEEVTTNHTTFNGPPAASQPTSEASSFSHTAGGVGTGLDWGFGSSPRLETSGLLTTGEATDDFLPFHGVNVDGSEVQPVAPGSVANESLRQLKGFAGGAIDEAKNMAMGVGGIIRGGWNLTGGWITDPDAATQSLARAKNAIDTIRDHPGDVARAIIKPYVTDWQAGNYGSAIGRGAVNFLPMLFGVGEADAVAEVGETAAMSSRYSVLNDSLIDTIGGNGKAESALESQQGVENLNPADLRFSQNTAGGNGRAEALRSSMIEKGWDGPAIDAVQTSDGISTIDNTRVAVARELGINLIPVQVHNSYDLLPPEMIGRFGESQTWGEALAHRTAQQRPPLPPTGTSTPPRLPPSAN